MLRFVVESIPAMSSIVTTRYRVLLVLAALLVSVLALPADVFAHNVVEARRRVRRRQSGRGHRPVSLPRRQAHGHRLRPPAVSRRRDLLPLPAEGRRPVRQPVHHRTQHHAAARRPRRHPRQPLHRRRDHRLLRRLQGLRQHGRVQALVRLPAEHEDRGAGLRSVPRLRAGDEAAGVCARRRTASWPIS